MLTRLTLDESSYRLLRRSDKGWIALALLPRGRQVDQRTLEGAIDHAEEANILLTQAKLVMPSQTDQ